MKKGLVTVLTPLYNLESLVSRLLDSVLMQSYPHVEMVVVNDGSTDNGAEVVMSYMEKFQARGYSLMLINQENQGLSSAIKNGLKYVNGEYLIWPDADDFYHSPDAFSKMVGVLENSDDTVGMVRCQVKMVNENDLDTMVHLAGKNNKPLEEVSLFSDCLFCENEYYYGSGAYMLKYQAYTRSSNGFYTNRTNGQNLQLCLPVLYHYRCASLSIPLHTYLLRQNSHSRHSRSYQKEIDTVLTHQFTRIETLKNIRGINSDELKLYSDKVMKLSLVDQYYIAYRHQNKEDLKRIKKELALYGGLPFKEFFRMRWNDIPVIPYIYRLLKRK